MKCESCQIREVDTEVLKYAEGCEPDTPEPPYKVCRECRERLIHKSLRPLEYFNLASIHGPFFYLNDDFYDEETGEALDPDTTVVAARKFPYPSLRQIQNDPERLIDYAFVLYYSSKEKLWNTLRKFDKQQLFEIIRKKVEYNPDLQAKAYEITALLIGREAAAWAEEQWSRRNPDQPILESGYATLLAGCLEPDEAFTLISTALEPYSPTDFYANIQALEPLKSEKTLDWLEKQTDRISGGAIGSNYGYLAAASGFSQERCERWLGAGRPLSLIALDALALCLSSDHKGHSFWQSHPDTKPTPISPDDRERIANALRNYLEKDNVTRTRNTIKRILETL